MLPLIIGLGLLALGSDEEKPASKPADKTEPKPDAKDKADDKPERSYRFKDEAGKFLGLYKATSATEARKKLEEDKGAEVAKAAKLEET